MNAEPKTAPPALAPALRPADAVMTPAGLSAYKACRFSFVRGFIRRICAERWRIERPRFDLDAEGRGTAGYPVVTGASSAVDALHGGDLHPLSLAPFRLRPGRARCPRAQPRGRSPRSAAEALSRHGQRVRPRHGAVHHQPPALDRCLDRRARG